MDKPNSEHNAGVIRLPEWFVYCFINHRSENVIREWLKSEKVEKTQIANFQNKIDLYERGGPDVSNGFIVGPVAKDIYKMKIKGRKGFVQLRPMLCRGPFSDKEITLLVGAIEKDSKLRPETWKEQAQTNREVLLTNPTRRRHERVG